ncbi:sensor histidine kinase [Bacillus altitudinis]|uniref:sensor histidine kinase n=1 Tax=Bacillus altitudinis TaxID=293387 RepID=UPI000BC308B5|nr:sensor histidine kinase [Bacillus altitudinis]ATH70836.1 sensor histidine kinase [Bacillus altitudinis]
MKKIPFRVSARTARLIGRENVTNADGAIIELVKNCYDADSNMAFVILDIKYSGVPNKLTVDDLDLFKSDEEVLELVNSLYTRVNLLEFRIKDAYSETEFNKLSDLLQRFNSIYIIDNGSGMTDDIIESYWMTIGTNNKENNIYSNGGRIVTGAKGIGRFALDRLGSRTQLLTLPSEKKIGYNWNVDWEDFENEEVLNDVNAELSELINPQLYKELIKLLGINHTSLVEELKDNLPSGTIMKISCLRDKWNKRMINNLYKSLETLIPPSEQKIFKIYLYDTKNSELYGKVENNINDDFDYKVTASLNDQQEVKIRIYRNEFNSELFPQEFFTSNIGKNFTQIDFEKGYVEDTYSLQQLIPGYKGYSYADIGNFEFTLYFMKKSYQRNDKRMYFYKDFNFALRSEWLEKFNGIKLFRDMFRIRPYGEIGSTSFDWLNLGERSEKSPAAPSHKSGRWRVRPYQVSGSITISRLTNINFEDKSSREGLQENETFSFFKTVIIGIIDVFEKDRQTIMRELRRIYERHNEREQNNKKAKKLAQNILNKDKKDYSNIDYEKFKDSPDLQTRFLAQRVLDFDKEKEELISEIKMLRALASTGLAITSFGHELKNISANIEPRTEELIEVLQDIIPSNTLNKQNDDNPYFLIEEFREQDRRLKNWLDFSLDAIRKDKRRRHKVDLYEIFKNFQRVWKKSLSYSHAELTVPESSIERFVIKLFPIDIDSIFNNLIANSFDAFQRPDATGERKINISFYEENKKAIVIYEDSGPGLSKDIKNANDIFESFFTTKRDSLGREIGTGLGMWIVKSTVEEYQGDIEILKKETGFGLKITLPLKKNEGVTYINE